MIEITVNDRLGKKVRVKCNEDDTIGDLKKLIAAQTGTRWDKIVLKKWYTIFKDHITLQDYEIHDGMGLELYYNCAFCRARLLGFRWSSFRYARLTAPLCFPQEGALLFTPFRSSSRARRSNSLLKWRVCDYARKTLREPSVRNTARAQCPQRAAAEEGDTGLAMSISNAR